MVQDKKARLGPEFDNGLASKDSGDRERPADQRDTRISSSRQRESESEDYNLKSKSRLASAIILQSLKDLCAGNPKEEAEIKEWASSDSFVDVCKSASMNYELVRDLMQELCDIPKRIRRDILLNRLKNKR
jgi:hypothetical protein